MYQKMQINLYFFIYQFQKLLLLIIIVIMMGLTFSKNMEYLQVQRKVVSDLSYLTTSGYLYRLSYNFLHHIQFQFILNIFITARVSQSFCIFNQIFLSVQVNYFVEYPLFCISRCFSTTMFCLYYFGKNNINMTLYFSECTMSGVT